MALTQALKRLEQLDRSATIMTALVIVLLVGGLDALAESAAHYSFASTLFYLLPIGVTAWVCGRPWGQFVTLAAAVMDAIGTVYLAEHRHPFIFPAIDMLLQLALFASFGQLLVMLKSTLERERRLSRTDPLTGILNVRGFQELAEFELFRMRRYGHAMTVVYLDVDDFKSINDKRGHSYGDELLKLIASSLKETVRTVDVPARLGGDEFVVLLPEATKEAAQGFVTRIKKALNHAVLNEVTFSIGAVTFDMAPASVDTLLAPADAMMYAAKRNGKNMVIIDQGPFPSAQPAQA
jgi:diguanylate cyclase (GGDEF)-like protein